MSAQKVDVLIIGAGPAGLAAAYALNESHSVLVVENDLWGGTCPNRGCDPKKMLYSAVETRQTAERLQGSGIADVPSIDWPALMGFKRSYTSKIPSGTHNGLKSSGIATLHGEPHFIDAHTVDVDNERYEAGSIIVATGQTPRTLDIEGAEYLTTSTDFLDLDELPDAITFIGGGYVSFELANIAAVAGSKVTLLNHSDRPLRAFPQDLVESLMDLMAHNGVTIQLNSDIASVSKHSDGSLTVATSTGEYSAGMVVNATGRVPNIAALNLEAAGVTTDSHGIVVDDHLRTTAPSIFAIGDLVSRREPKLTPVAGFEGRYVAGVITDPQAEPISYPSIPTIVFGAEKLAQIGVSVNSARENPDDYVVETLDTTQWYTYNRVQDPKATVLLVREKASKKVVGVAALSSVADEVINQFAEKFNGEKAIYAYPTPASDMSYFA